MKNDIFINTMISIGGGYILLQLQLLLETQYLTNFLKQNLLTLLVALIAINSATLSIVLTKIRDLLDKIDKKSVFENTKQQMILSINEQIVLIVVSIIFLTVQDSKLIQVHTDVFTIINVLLIGCFIYALRLLYDTAKSVFVILDY